MKSMSIEIWKHIVFYCDYYTNYINFEATCKFFQTILQRVQEEYIQTTFCHQHHMHPANISAQLYEKVEPNRPWKKKLLNF